MTGLSPVEGRCHEAKSVCPGCFLVTTKNIYHLRTGKEKNVFERKKKSTTNNKSTSRPQLCKFKHPHLYVENDYIRELISRIVDRHFFKVLCLLKFIPAFSLLTLNFAFITLSHYFPNSFLKKNLLNYANASHGTDFGSKSTLLPVRI